MRSTLLAALAVVAAVTLATPSARAQNVAVDPVGRYVFQFDENEGERLEDFVDLGKNILGRPIKYSAEEMANTRVKIIGPVTVERDKFFQFFQAVLKAYDFIVVTYGPSGSDFLSVQKISAGGPGRAGGGAFVKAQAPIVPVEDLHKFADDPASLITTSIPLKYIDARNAMSTFNPFFDQQIEQVRTVENSNALVITGFGTNVWGAYQLVGLVDVPPFQPQPHIVKRELQHASVDEVEPVLTELLAAAQGLRPGQTAAPQQAGALAVREVEPRIIVDPRSNALLLTGEEDMVARIETWIDMLDLEVEPRGFTHVYRLKNTDADSVEEVLNRVLQDERANQGQARTGPGATGGSSLEIPASVVADQTSNSLIITASDRKYAEIVETLRDLDVRRRQVLVEAAIVETAKTLNEVFRAGVGYASDDDGAFISNFGTPLALPLDDSGNPDVGAAGDIITAGGTLAKFSMGDIPIPIILEWLETNTETRVMSRPSLLTNDNEEAELASEEETSYRTATTTQNGVTTENFETITAGIVLSISPTISAGNYLRLFVRLSVSDFQPARSGLEGAPPDKTIREIETPVTVPDGNTIILGGLVSHAQRESESKVPWLGDVPLLGWFFRSSDGDSTDRYLYVFITCHIMDTDFALLDQISAARKQDYERLGGDVSELVGSMRRDDATVELTPLVGIREVFELPAVAMPVSGERPMRRGGDDLGGVFGYEEQP